MLFIHLLLKVRKHLDELVLGSIVPCPGALGREDSFFDIFDMDVENGRMLIRRLRVSCGG